MSPFTKAWLQSYDGLLGVQDDREHAVQIWLNGIMLSAQWSMPVVLRHAALGLLEQGAAWP